MVRTVGDRALEKYRATLARFNQLNSKHADTQALPGMVLEELGDALGALPPYRWALELNPQTELAKEGLESLSAQD